MGEPTSGRPAEGHPLKGMSVTPEDILRMLAGG